MGKSSFGALEDAGGSSLGFGILILIWIWSLVFDIPMIQILALYLDFESAKNIHVVRVLIWGFGGRWRFLTGILHLDLDWDRGRNLAWIFPEVLITLRSVKSKIEVLVEAQIGSDKLCQGRGSGRGRVGSGSWFEI